MGEYCLYIHKRVKDDVVFYVGIGKPDRPYRLDGRSDYWGKYTNKYEYYVVVLENNLSWSQACEKEIGLINEIGTIKLGNGTLLNLTRGGEGFTGRHTEKTKRIISEKGRGREPWNKGLTATTDERVRKSSEKNIGREPWNKGCVGCQTYTEERNKKLSEIMTGKEHTEESKIKIGNSSRGRLHSEESKDKIRKAFQKQIKQIFDSGETKVWGSIKEAQESLGINNISQVVNGKRKKAGGCKWIFVE